ncbi:unnamed protein product [Brachionus calyciflorus]|uniref:Uncharacterized protein n=1 Tax=Brachionus calyciflorus TaxID=104777 RepID=A0A813VFJ3_9BILA|nr:unnamed protein product [Brachionus calyciflorus]
MAASLNETVKNAPGEIPTNEIQKVNIKENPNKKHLLLGKNVEYYDLKRMPVILRSKFAFYVEPKAEVAEAQTYSKKQISEFNKNKILERKKQLITIMETSQSIYSSSVSSANDLIKDKKTTLEEAERIIKIEKDRHDRLIGQLKAAEARNRNRILKMKYFNAKQDEIDHIIESQPTAIKAVRLEAFLPPVRTKKQVVSDKLNPIERRRLEAIIDDDANSLIGRRL